MAEAIDMTWTENQIARIASLRMWPVRKPADVGCAGGKITDHWRSEQMASADCKAPQGVVAILTGPDGRQIANAADFDPSTSSGFDSREAQKTRAKRALARAAIKALSSPLLANAIDWYDAERIMEKMDCRIHFVLVGYDDT